MAKTVCKCGAEYEDGDDPYDDFKVDACPRCSNYARAETLIAPETQTDEFGRIVRVTWAPKKPTRVLD